ncbi:MAG: hypothetical protein HC831_07770 [Chloroflexia bacterium]|nr:hypothetical protein [Chloroflexia bacterium]
MPQLKTEVIMELSSKVAGIEASQKKVEGFVNKARSSFGAIGGIIAGAFAAETVIEFGKAIFDASAEMLKLKNTISVMTKTSGKELDDLTGKVHAMNKVFDQSTGDILKSSQSLSKSFGIDFADALELTEKGIALAGDQGGEFLEQLKEYPAQFKAAGYSAEEAISIITQTLKDGVFSDKGADAIKEATLRIRQMPKATKDAIDALGLSSDTIIKQLSNGTISIKDVINRVSKALSKLPEDSRLVGTALADIFGAAGEDGGYKVVVGFHKGSEGLDKAIADDPIAHAKIEYTNAASELASTWSNILGKDSTWWINLKTDVLKLTNQILSLTPGASVTKDADIKKRFESDYTNVTTSGDFSAKYQGKDGKVVSYEKAIAAVKKLIEAEKEGEEHFKKVLEEQQKLAAGKEAIVTEKADEVAANTGTAAAKAYVEAYEDEIDQTDWKSVFDIADNTVVIDGQVKTKGSEFGDKAEAASSGLPALDTLGSVNEGLDETINKWQDLETEMGKAQAMSDGINDMSSSLFAFISASEDAEGNWAKVAANMLALVAKMITSYIALMAAQSASANAALPFGAGIAVAAGAIAGFLALISPYIGQRATGGPMEPGVTYRINEKGEEFITTSQGGYVFNAGQTRNMTQSMGGSVRLIQDRDELVGLLRLGELKNKRM